MAGGWSCGGSTGVSLCGVSCGWLGLGCLLGVLGVLGGLAALLGATKFWQDTPFLMNLLNWPEAKPMLLRSQAHCWTLAAKIGSCSGVGPESRMPEKVAPSKAPLSSFLMKSL